MVKCVVPECHNPSSSLVTSFVSPNPVPCKDGVYVFHEIGSYFMCKGHMLELAEVYNPALRMYTTTAYGLPN